jgi:uncharacterized lipoprotein YajG
MKLLALIAGLALLAGCVTDQSRADIARSAAVIDGAARSLPASPQTEAIRANAAAIAHAVGHDLGTP